MWVNRTEYEELRVRLGAAILRAELAERELAAVRRYHATQTRELLRRVRIAEKREAESTDLAAEERESNRAAERHWANALLRAKQAYPLPAPKSAVPVNGGPPSPFEPARPDFDQGELDALIATGAARGVDAKTATELYYRELDLHA